MADEVFRDPAFAGPVTNLNERFNLQKVSWGAIWAGAMVTLGLEALFLLFGVFIGAAIGGSVVWTMAWYLITMGVSFGIGGLCAGRLSDVASREIGSMHGLATWGLATTATILLAAVVGSALVRIYVVPAPFSAFWNGFTEQWVGLIWGGSMLSMLTAYAGGASGFPALPRQSQRRTSGQQIPVERRA